MQNVKIHRFFIENEKEPCQHIRRGGRGILFQDGKILLGIERANGFCCIPGGGQEQNESLEETCIREIAEEMGICAAVEEKAAIVQTRWKNWLYENHFFICSCQGETEKNLTQEEALLELSPLWVSIEEAVRIFSNPVIKDEISAWSGCYQRDLWVMQNIVMPLYCGKDHM